MKSQDPNLVAFCKSSTTLFSACCSCNNITLGLLEVTAMISEALCVLQDGLRCSCYLCHEGTHKDGALNIIAHPISGARGPQLVTLLEP